MSSAVWGMGGIFKILRGGGSEFELILLVSEQSRMIFLFNNNVELYT